VSCAPPRLGVLPNFARLNLGERDVLAARSGGRPPGSKRRLHPDRSGLDRSRSGQPARSCASGTAAGRGSSDWSRPPARASRGRSEGLRGQGRHRPPQTRALGPGLPDPKGKVNGDADVREIANPQPLPRVQSTGLQTGESVLRASSLRRSEASESLGAQDDSRWRPVRRGIVKGKGAVASAPRTSPVRVRLVPSLGEAVSASGPGGGGRRWQEIWQVRRSATAE
jgi:hypothetical protein